MTDVNHFFYEVARTIHSRIAKSEINEVTDSKWHHNFYDGGYVIDLVEGEMKQARGFNKLLGYEDAEMDLAGVFGNIHPDDASLVKRITRLGILHCLDNPDPQAFYKLMITNRYRNKAGKYIRVLTKIDVLETDAKGTLLKLLVSLKNISFMDASAQVQWVFEAPNLNLDDFFNEVYAPYQAFFTPRELEIIKEMMQGTNNNKIAGNLSISPHTVATHRKNILKKAQCSTIDQLTKYCKEIGVLKPHIMSTKIP